MCAQYCNSEAQLVQNIRLFSSAYASAKAAQVMPLTDVDASASSIVTASMPSDCPLATRVLSAQRAASVHHLISYRMHQRVVANPCYMTQMRNDFVCQSTETSLVTVSRLADLSRLVASCKRGAKKRRTDVLVSTLPRTDRVLPTPCRSPPKLASGLQVLHAGGSSVELVPPVAIDAWISTASDTFSCEVGDCDGADGGIEQPMSCEHYSCAAEGGLMDTQKAFSSRVREVATGIWPAEDGDPFPGPGATKYPRQCEVGFCRAANEPQWQLLHREILNRLEYFRQSLCKPKMFPLHDVFVAFHYTNTMSSHVSTCFAQWTVSKGKHGIQGATRIPLIRYRIAVWYGSWICQRWYNRCFVFFATGVIRIALINNYFGHSVCLFIGCFDRRCFQFRSFVNHDRNISQFKHIGCNIAATVSIPHSQF